MRANITNLLSLSVLILILTTSLSMAVAGTIQPEVRDFVRETTQPARVEAFHIADIDSKVTGYVRVVLVDIGDSVSKGQALVKINAPEMLEQRKIIQAEQGGLAAGVAAAKANLNAIRAETKRVLRLIGKGTLSEKAGDEAIKKRAAATAELAAAKAKLKMAIARLGEINVLIAYATIKAPFDGVVTYRTVDPGDLVYAADSSKGSGQPLIRVAQTNKLRIVTHIPERDAVWLDVGDPVSITFDAIPGKIFSGKVARTARALHAGTQRMRAEVDLDNANNANGKIFPGLYGRVAITLENHTKAIVLPAGSIRFDEGGPLVYVVSGGKVRHRKVGLGLDHGGWIEITSGLSGKEQIISGMIGRISDGAAYTAR